MSNDAVATSVAIVVIAKAPRPGTSKTRMCPPLDHQQAADLATAALSDTFDAVAASSAARRVLAIDGEIGDWTPSGWDVIAQRGDGLDQRLAAAFDDVGGPAVIIAMDTPQVTPGLLDAALAALRDHDAVLGATPDGGYWNIGLASPAHDVIRGVPMSTSETFDRQVERIEIAGLRLALVDPLTDVDDFDTAVEVAALIPDSRFGRLVDGLIRELARPGE